MMSPAQMIEFFESSTGRVDAGVALATKSKNFWLASTNLKQGFKIHLMVGLLKWRHGLGLPQPHLKNSISLARRAYATLASIDPDIPIWEAFPVGLAVVVNSLAGEQEAELLSVVPTQLEWAKVAPDTPGALREWLLAHSLQHPEEAGACLAVLQRSTVPTREALAHETFVLYLSALSSAGTACIPEAIRAAEALFARRRRDAYFSGAAQYYGGGPDNEHVVDFMLAAVLRRVGAKSSSEHAWRWT